MNQPYIGIYRLLVEYGYWLRFQGSIRVLGCNDGRWWTYVPIELAPLLKRYGKFRRKRG